MGLKDQGLGIWLPRSQLMEMEYSLSTRNLMWSLLLCSTAPAPYADARGVLMCQGSFRFSDIVLRIVCAL